MNKNSPNISAVVDENVTRSVDARVNNVAGKSENWLMKLANQGYRGWAANHRSRYGC